LTGVEVGVSLTRGLDTVLSHSFVDNKNFVMKQYSYIALRHISCLSSNWSCVTCSL